VFLNKSPHFFNNAVFFGSSLISGSSVTILANSRILANVSTIARVVCVAVGLFIMVASMYKPFSVKAEGIFREPPQLEINIFDFKLAHSSQDAKYYLSCSLNIV